MEIVDVDVLLKEQELWEMRQAERVEKLAQIQKKRYDEDRKLERERRSRRISSSLRNEPTTKGDSDVWQSKYEKYLSSSVQNILVSGLSHLSLIQPGSTLYL